MIPAHAELPLDYAADWLNVSRGFLESLIYENKIRCQTVGPDRRVFFEDILDYNKRTDAERLAALEELAVLGQEIGEGV